MCPQVEGNAQHFPFSSQGGFLSFHLVYPLVGPALVCANGGHYRVVK